MNGSPARGPRVRGSAGEAVEGDRDYQYDLLTATVLGLAVGIGATLLLRRGPSGNRPIAPMMRGVARGAAVAGRSAAEAGMRGARWAREQGEELWDRVPREEIEEQVSDMLGRARETVDDVVSNELRDLRRAIRRQRRRLGV